MRDASEGPAGSTRSEVVAVVAAERDQGTIGCMDLVELARRVVADRFPDARAAFLAGSAGEGSANEFSDLDIVVLLDGPPAPYRETIRVEGWPVELFVHTDESIVYWLDRERQQGGCTLANMLATCKPLAGPDVDEVSAKPGRC